MGARSTADTLRCVLRLSWLAVVGLATILAACGGSERRTSSTADVSGPRHVHGLGVDPKDGSLFIATHTGLLRSEANSTTAEPVGSHRRDTMGFTVLDDGRFLASGHPAPGDDAPPLLGLLESRDAGRTWRTIVLRGAADLHTIRAAGGRLYAHDAAGNRLMTGSVDASGFSQVRSPAGTLVDLAVDPSDSDRLMAATDRGLFTSKDSGMDWNRITENLTGLLAYTDKRLLLFTADGNVSRRVKWDWRPIGALGGPPAAVAYTGGRLYAAREDGSVVQSSDDGRTWKLRLAK